MDFSTDIFELQQDKNVKIYLDGVKLPNNRDVFFRAKQEEILEQYVSARIFLRETATDDWQHWFDKPELEEHQEIFELLFMQRMYETALIYYNIVVDLSWTLCYVSAEYFLYEKDKKINIDDMMSIDEAYNAMRKAEKLVTSPNIEGNPFEYLKQMSPDFKNSVDLIIDFWKDFKDSNIRVLYNFIKHRGKPLYEEVEKFKGPKLMGITMKGKSLPTDIREVQKKINLRDSIGELKDFDDKILYPYIEKLFQLLELAVNPSPLIS